MEVSKLIILSELEKINCYHINPDSDLVEINSVKVNNTCMSSAVADCQFYYQHHELWMPASKMNAGISTITRECVKKEFLCFLKLPETAVSFTHSTSSHSKEAAY